MAQDIVHRLASGAGVAKAVAERFADFTEQCIAETGSCVVAISGGTTPNALFELLANAPYIKRLDWERIYFLWVDERFVPSTNPDSNFYRAKERLFGNIGRSCHFYPVPTDGGAVEEAATAYEKEVAVVLKACGKEQLDLALLGLGDDGHTASLFPRSVALSEKNRIVTYVKDGKVWDRVTMTFPFLSKARHAWFTVVGDSKAAALARVFRQRRDYADERWEERIGHVLPGAVLNQEGLEWYIDDAAAKCLG